MRGDTVYDAIYGRPPADREYSRLTVRGHDERRSSPLTVDIQLDGRAYRGCGDALAPKAAPARHVAQRLSYSSWRRHQTPVSLRPLGARSSHWYMPQRPSTPRE